MDVPDISVKCSSCKKYLDIEYANESSKSPCPFCGENGKEVTVNIEEKIELHETLNLKSKKKGIKKPRQEIITGDDYYVKEKRWVKKTRVIDRDNNQYTEEVKEINGEILHKCDEPLSDHFGHGSAKNKK